MEKFYLYLVCVDQNKNFKMFSVEFHYNHLYKYIQLFKIQDMQIKGNDIPIHINFMYFVQKTYKQYLIDVTGFYKPETLYGTDTSD
jgi:hypothetical protein